MESKMVKKKVDSVIKAELIRLRGNTLQLSVAGMNFNPTGVLETYDENTGRILLRRPSDHVAIPVETMCLNAATVIAVGHYTGYPK